MRTKAQPRGHALVVSEARHGDCLRGSATACVELDELRRGLAFVSTSRTVGHRRGRSTVADHRAGSLLPHQAVAFCRPARAPPRSGLTLACGRGESDLMHARRRRTRRRRLPNVRCVAMHLTSEGHCVVAIPIVKFSVGRYQSARPGRWRLTHRYTRPWRRECRFAWSAHQLGNSGHDRGALQGGPLPKRPTRRWVPAALIAGRAPGPVRLPEVRRPAPAALRRGRRRP